jgi:hypothetical protein
MALMRNKTARQHDFAVVPRADIPRSKFRFKQTRKQAFDASELIPIMCEEVLPGDTWSHTEAILARLATPIAPLIDDMSLETFYFFVPNRITWKYNGVGRWEPFITGEEDTYTIPQVRPGVSGVGFNIITGGFYDHLGIPPATNAQATYNVLPTWAYFTIWNEWFRDQNLQEKYIWTATWTSTTSYAITNDGVAWDQNCVRVNKRSDYFTRSLPWPQKGDAVELPLGSTAPVISAGDGIPIFNVDGQAQDLNLEATSASDAATYQASSGFSGDLVWDETKLQADLSSATAATINAIRLAFQTQKMLERDARGGSRYVEQLMAHWGVVSPDGRMQRPEYLGGSNIPITVNPVAQTAAYDANPADEASAVGNLGAEMHAAGRHKTFTYAATEHGYIMGLAVVRATPTYQQGVRRHFRRSTRLDYYLPVFAHLGEQAVLTQEIYQPADNSPSEETWGYQERWAELRYTPNEITGVLRSTASEPLDWWHLAEEFASEPALNAAFMYDKTQETLARALATAPSEQWSAQIIMDINHDSTVARLMPVYSVPGQVDRF